MLTFPGYTAAMPKALIFDFDGVIVLSEEARLKVMQQIALRHNFVIPEDHLHVLVGTTTQNYLTANFPRLSEADRQAIQQDFNAEFKDKVVDHMMPISATCDFIKKYDGPVPMCVASGSDIKVLETMLKHIGIAHKFQHVFSKEHVTKSKPHPEIYQLTAHTLGVAPEDCLVIEDSVSGVTAAIAAAIPVYVFLNELNSKEQFASLPISGFVSTTRDIEALLA